MYIRPAEVPSGTVGRFAPASWLRVRQFAAATPTLVSARDPSRACAWRNPGHSEPPITMFARRNSLAEAVAKIAYPGLDLSHVRYEGVVGKPKAS